MFKIIYNVIICFALIYSLYYLIMAIFAFFKTKKSKKINKDNYFSIIIAARNEEKVIGKLIDSLKDQNYDKNHYEINIFINNCTDNTFEVASKKKINVYKCDIPVTCKADVLRYAFDKFKKRDDIDAYVVFDADNVVHPDFLAHMNDSLNSGAKVAQSMRETKNLGSNWISTSYAIYFYLQNYFINKSRKNLGLSVPINGTGFMIKKELIDELGFNTKSLTEDIEFSAICALNKTRIDYVKEAITYDEQPTSFNVSWNQRMRWTKGTYECIRLYNFKLIKNFFKTFNLANIDMLFVFLAPVVQITSFLVIFLDIIIKIFSSDFINTIRFYLTTSLIGTICTYVITIIATIFVILYNKHKLKKTWPGILLFTLFVFSWLPINIICLFKRKVSWEQIEHNHTLSINEVIKK